MHRDRVVFSATDLFYEPYLNRSLTVPTCVSTIFFYPRDPRAVAAAAAAVAPSLWVVAAPTIGLVWDCLTIFSTAIFMFLFENYYSLPTL